MFSRCSYCQTQQPVTIEQLRIGRGLLVCAECGKHFDALAALSERADAEVSAETVLDVLDNLQRKPTNAGIWRLATALVLLLLLLQVWYFKADELIRQPPIRIGLLTICNYLGCHLPIYKNLDEWSVSHSQLLPQSESSYTFTAAITNQAIFPQACPDLKLIFLDFKGQAIAERVFLAQQYSSISSLAANETTEIKLAVIIPPGPLKVGGYTLVLL